MQTDRLASSFRSLLTGTIYLLVYFASDILAADPTINPALGTGAPTFSFVVWGHPRDGDGEPPLHFDEILTRIRTLGADLLIVTGDSINGMYGKTKIPEILEGDWERFQRGLDSLGIPYYVSPGNHDANDPTTRDLFLARFEKPPYAITFQGSRFVILDSVGIDPQTRGPTSYQRGRPDTWYAGPIPFDAAQRDFIRAEVAQSDRFDHMFIFFHHSEVWLDSTSDWWTEFHPLLKDSRVRAVITGNPYAGKYRHFEQDGVQYIESATFPTPPASLMARRHPGRRESAKTPDNLQWIRVAGAEVYFETIVVGAHDTPGLSPIYWEEVARLRSQRQSPISRFQNWIASNNHLVRWGAGAIAVCLAIGVALGLTLAWAWRRLRAGNRESA